VAFIVVYDACVLHPAPLRDLLIRIASTGIVRARWSARILDECFTSILRTRPDLTPEALRRTRELMERAIPDALAPAHEWLAAPVELPDPDDRHVVATAIQSAAQVIVTFNLKDFPASALTPLGIEAQHPDDFVMHCLSLAPGVTLRAFGEQVAGLRHPPLEENQVLDMLRGLGLVRTAAQLRVLVG
jgi:predicted nucleic acid-binding protein